MKKIYAIIFFLLLTLVGKSQSDSIDTYLERLIEGFVENNDIGEEFDYAANFEVLDDIRKKPYDLNTVTEEDLNNLFFLNASQRQAIINHRQEYGDFIALEELQNIDVIDTDILKLLLFFVTVEPELKNEFNWRNAFVDPSQTLFTKYKRVLQDKKGYQLDDSGNKRYIGDANHYFLRYRLESNNNFKIGFTAEKDAGEQFFSGSNKKGFDFYSGYLFVQNINRKIKTLALGDYTLSFGQGLILHNDFGAGKSAFVMNIKKGGRVIRPYSSVNEANYFRGIAATFLPFANTELTLLYSNKKIDGSINLDTLDIDRFENITSLVRDGYHRTQAEIDKQNSVTQQNFGGRLSYKKGNLSLGIHHLSYLFSNQYSKDEQLYNLYAFKGKNLHNTGIDYNYYYKNLTLFGEVARSNNGGIAQIHSLLMPLDRRLDFSVSYRNFSPDYQVLEANAFSESSLPINEKAIYFGIEVRPNNSWKFSTYLDFWKNPWLKFRVDAPSEGRELLARIEYTIKRKFNIYLQYRYEEKYQNTSLANEKIDYTTSLIQHRARLHLSHKVNKEIELRSRAEMNLFSKEANQSKGYLVYQDFIYKPIGKSYSFTGRYALFDTEGFDSRIYAYENDILYEFAIPFYANTGRRAYINFRHKITRFLTWEARYAITTYNDIDVISQGGNEEIIGNTKSDVKVQLKWSF